MAEAAEVQDMALPEVGVLARRSPGAMTNTAAGAATGRCRARDSMRVEAEVATVADRGTAEEGTEGLADMAGAEGTEEVAGTEEGARTTKSPVAAMTVAGATNIIGA